MWIACPIGNSRGKNSPSPVSSLACAENGTHKHNHYAVNFREVVGVFCLLWSQQLPHQKHPDISFHIHNYMMGGINNSSSKAFHTCRWWKGCRAQHKTLLCILSSLPLRWLAPSIMSSVDKAALNNGDIRRPQPLSAAGQRSRRWSNIHTASYLYLRIHSALACIINAQEWEEWERMAR